MSGLGGLAGALLLLALTGCGGGEPVPSAAAGEGLFNANCAACHGEKAVGTPVGPPLAHPVYEPGHHPDFAFRNAVSNGVRAHHWPYGDMPPVAGLAPEEVDSIICYVRELQRAEGIGVGDGC